MYGAQGIPRHTDLHFDPQATTFLSPPGGISLISCGLSLTTTPVVRVLVLVLWEQARVKNMELAEIREIFGRRTPASADDDENSRAVMRARCHSDPRI